MSLDPASRVRFNLAKTTVLLLDSTPIGLAILAQILSGLGVKQLYRCTTRAEAEEVVGAFGIDLMIVDGVPATGEGYDFVRWLRQAAPEPNKFAPVLVTAGHTMLSDVARARDCGGHLLIAKPLAPIVVLERIIWVAKGRRAFLFSDHYVGPDRRFSEEGRPSGLPGRRREDRLAAESGEHQTIDEPLALTAAQRRDAQ
jgi:DNA-binding response OmpR family regulator